MVKPGGGDGGIRLARQMAARGERRPQPAAVGQAREGALGLAPREHVLVETQLTAGAQHAPQFRQRAALVRDTAEDELTTAASSSPSANGNASASPATTVTGTDAGASAASARKVGSGSIATTSLTVGG